MTILDSIRKHIGSECMHHYCKKSGCTRTIKKENVSFSLRKAPAPHFLVDFDKNCNKKNCNKKCSKIGPNAQCCDWLFIANSAENRTVWVVPIEGTKKQKTVNEVKNQLQAGLNFSEYILPKGISPNFRPLFIGKWNKKDVKTLRKQIIKYKGKTLLINSAPPKNVYYLISALQNKTST